MSMMLEHFELNSRIASGGMGTVYRATDTVLQRDVAIKLMQPELADDEEGLEAFYAEARAVATERVGNAGAVAERQELLREHRRVLDRLAAALPRARERA